MGTKRSHAAIAAAKRQRQRKNERSSRARRLARRAEQGLAKRNEAAQDAESAAVVAPEMADALRDVVGAVNVTELGGGMCSVEMTAAPGRDLRDVTAAALRAYAKED